MKQEVIEIIEAVESAVDEGIDEDVSVQVALDKLPVEAFRKVHDDDCYDLFLALDQISDQYALDGRSDGTFDHAERMAWTNWLRRRIKRAKFRLVGTE